MAKTTKRHKNAAFSPNQETWIILEYEALRNVSHEKFPLDYWFWSICMAEVSRVQPQSLDELQVCVERYAQSLSVQQVNKAVNSIFKRAKCCIDQNGGTFEKHLKKAKVTNQGDN